MNAGIKTDQILLLENFFKDLSLMDQKKILTGAFRKAAKPLIQRAKATAPKGKTGNLINSIGTMAISNNISILVGALKQRKGWHGHLIESGTEERFRRTKKGAATGKVKGTKFFENAYNASEREITNTIEAEWLREIDNLIIRTNRRI